MSAHILIIRCIIIAFLATVFAHLRTMPEKARVVGIDLGTTYSVVAVKIDGQVHVVPDRFTNKSLVPSIASFLDNGTVLAGHAAAEQRHTRPFHTIFNAKRFIGRTMDEAAEHSQNVPFKTGANPNDFSNETKNQTGFLIPTGHNDAGLNWVSPVNIGTKIILHLKQSIADYLGYNVSRATICVPAKFDEQQIEATKLAFEEAGFGVARIITEPTAAALAYNLHMPAGARYVLIYDIGGGTLDVSLLYINGMAVNILGLAGDEHLGGANFDTRMLDLIEAKLAKDQSHQSCPKDELHAISEEAKIHLTKAQSTDIHCVASDGTKRLVSISREEFEQASADLFDRALKPVDKVLSDQMMMPDQVDDIVLVGGASRMPQLRKSLQDFFGPDKTLHTNIDPDITIAVGAANVLDGAGR